MATPEKIKRYVLDSWAVLAFLEGEKAGEPVMGILEEAEDGHSEILLSVVNWSEMCYIALREGGEERAARYIGLLGDCPIGLAMVDEDQAFQAAIYKARNRMSLADAFAASLAKRQGAILVTGDAEFKPLEKELGIRWLR